MDGGEYRCAASQSCEGVTVLQGVVANNGDAAMVTTATTAILPQKCLQCCDDDDRKDYDGNCNIDDVA